MDREECLASRYDLASSIWKTLSRLPVKKARCRALMKTQNYQTEDVQLQTSADHVPPAAMCQRTTVQITGSGQTHPISCGLRPVLAEMTFKIYVNSKRRFALQLRHWILMRTMQTLCSVLDGNISVHPLWLQKSNSSASLRGQFSTYTYYFSRSCDHTPFIFHSQHPPKSSAWDLGLFTLP